MRTLSKKTQYSLRALYNLSAKHGGPPVVIAGLAAEESIPKKFLEQILLMLKERGLVDSKPGRSGGYFLARAPEEITVGEVIRLIEGPLAPLPCASETRYRKCEECVDARVCGTRMVMREVRDAIAGVLDRTSLSDVVRRAQQARAEGEREDALMYYI